MAAKLRVVGNAEDAFVTAASAMPVNYLECRATQHRWDITDDFRVVDSRVEHGKRPHLGRDVYAERILICDRCGMIRTDHYEITSRGGHTLLLKLNATYDAPDGYATQGLGRVQGNRGLILGLTLERQLKHPKTRKTKRGKNQ